MKKLILTLIMSVSLAITANAAVNTPVLKFSNSGTYANWTEESYFCSPVVTDLDNDGANEIIFSNYSITVLDASGNLKWRVNSGADRTAPFVEIGGNNGHTWCDIKVLDVDGDGFKEIVSVHGNGAVSVLTHDGYMKSGWPQYPIRGALRSLEVADLDNDSKMEIIVGAGVESALSVWVYNYNGTLRSGWPQMDPSNYAGTSQKDYRETGWSYGVFMNGITAGDIDNDGYKEIIVPTDTSFVAAYRHDGTLVKANSTQYGGRTWAKIPFYENYLNEIRLDNEGWGYEVTGTEKREELYKAEFGHGYAKIADLDNDGKKEIVITGIMANRKYSVYPPTEYMTLFIVNADRTRYYNPSKGFDWRTIPTDLGSPLVQEERILCSMVEQEPAICDLDGDGINEILFASYNGKVECFSLNRKSNYAWPFSLTKRTSPLYEYATAPVCVDLDGDGKKEVIFASRYDEHQNLPGVVNGSLYILSYEGKLLSKTPLPPAKENVKNNGSMAKVNVTDLDKDGRYEIIVNTLNGAICVYDI